MKSVRAGSISSRPGLLHRLVANRAVETGIDDQIAVFPFDHIGIQIFEGAVGQRHDDPVQARENFFRHFNPFFPAGAVN
jgi:hypothetical protein